MTELRFEQAIYGDLGMGGYHFVAASEGFLDEWKAEAQRLCMGFGERPPGVACPLAIFAQPFGRKHVAIVQVADQGRDETGRPGALGFRLIVIPAQFYAALGGDPLALSERFPPDWQGRGLLPPLLCPAESPPPRTVEQVRQVIVSPQSATLLGGAQVLVEGGRLAFERSAPDPQLVRSLWTLLPNSTRAELWPATFAFGNALKFDVLILPRIEEETLHGYVPEDQAGDYPEGRYEATLHAAVEQDDQQALDRLFNRRSLREITRVMLGILVLMLAVVVGSALLSPPEKPARPRARSTTPGPNLPAAEKCVYPRDEQERQELTRRLRLAAERLGLEIPGSAENPASPEELLHIIDVKLGVPDPDRRGGPLRNLGPIERQLRALLWKHHVEGYDDLKLNTLELLERLNQKVPALRARKP